MTFRSKISWGLFFPLLLALFFGACFALWSHEVASGIILLVTIILVLLLILNTTYKVTNEQVLITSAFIIKEAVFIKDITHIIENRSIMSAPAASFDRIYLKTKTGRKNISPKNKEIFIHLLLEINKDIEVVRLQK